MVEKTFLEITQFEEQKRKGRKGTEMIGKGGKNPKEKF
jgi:hypothetical protein